MGVKIYATWGTIFLKKNGVETVSVAIFLALTENKASSIKFILNLIDKRKTRLNCQYS